MREAGGPTVSHPPSVTTRNRLAGDHLDGGLVRWAVALLSVVAADDVSRGAVTTAGAEGTRAEKVPSKGESPHRVAVAGHPPAPGRKSEPPGRPT